MERDLVSKLRPRKFFYVHDVVKKFDDVIGVRPYVLPFRARRRGDELVAHVMRTTARRHNYVFKTGKVADEQFLGCARLRFAAAVRHRLSAAGLIEGIVDLDTELF